MWDVLDVPEGCPQAAHDARSEVLDVCLELDTSLNYGDYLDFALGDACDNQQIRLQGLIDDNMGRTTASDAEKAALFETWWMLEGSNFPSAVAFQSEMEDIFDAMFMNGNGDIDPVDPMIDIELVPSNCNS